MLPCDSEGYIVEPQSQPQSPGQQGRGAQHRILDLLQEQKQQQRRQTKAKSSPAVAIVRAQETLGSFYHQAAAFIETSLLTRATLCFLNKYFLYPFLSGAFSASLSLYRLASRR